MEYNQTVETLALRVEQLKGEGRMIVVTTETVANAEIEKVLGLVQGSVVRSKHLGRDIAAGLKSLAGGELKGYTEMLIQARNEALQRMINEAEALGADAVVAMRFTSSAVMSGAAEMVAYGTAVKLKQST